MSKPIRDLSLTKTTIKRLKIVAYSIIGCITIIFTLFPIVWVVSASFNPLDSISSQRLIPANPTVENYVQLLTDPSRPFSHWFLNSVKISSITSILVVSLTTLGAYAFSRFRFRGRRSLLVTILLVQVFPNTLAIVAIFLIVQQIGFYFQSFGLNTHGGLILVYLGAALGGNVWLMKGFFDTIPRELDEAALIDGASHWQSFWRIILPLMRPMLVVITILSFIGTYGDVIIARVLLRDSGQYTLAIGLWMLIQGWYTEEWGVFTAGALLGAAPVIIVFYALQNQLVSGLTQGAIKG